MKCSIRSRIHDRLYLFFEVQQNVSIQPKTFVGSSPVGPALGDGFGNLKPRLI